MPETFTDWEGSPLIIGTRVFGDPEQPHGTVTGFTDVDGDVDEDGRQIVLYPHVIVKWDDQEETERFSTYWMGNGPYDEAPFQCDDLEVVKSDD